MTTTSKTPELPPALHATTCTDCDYCGRIAICHQDGHGGKGCRSCLASLERGRQQANREAGCQLLAVEVTRDYDEDGECRWFVTPVYRRHGRVVTVPDDRGWGTSREAFGEAEQIRESAQKRGTWASREAI